MQTAWYLMYASPSSRFLIDGRVPFYGPEHVREVGQAMTGAGNLRELLVRYRVDSVVFDFTSSDTQGALRSMTGIEGYYPIAIEDDHVLFAAFLPGREALFDRRVYRVLPPALDPAPLLGETAPVTRLEDEVSRLGEDGHTDAIRAWYAGILNLRPLSRGLAAGFRAPSDEATKRHALDASDLLSRAAEHYPAVPIVHAYAALAALAACRPLEVAEASERARQEGGNREAALAVVEMALRTGDEGPAVEMLAAASDPMLRNDPWLEAIRADLEADVRCDPQH
jgi:hypothetical protein